MDNKLKKFNIETFFPSDKNINGYNGKFDINTLFKTKTDNEELEILNPAQLIEIININKKKVMKHYTLLYNACGAKIKSANNYGITDIIFDIPEFITDCPEYNSLDCVKFIKKNLQEQIFDTYIISEIQLFISWHKLMLNHKIKIDL